MRIALGRDGHEARFAASLCPEIFFGLQVLADPEAKGFAAWRERALAAFPRHLWPLDMPPGMWPAVPDIVNVDPTEELSDVIAALNDVPARVFQERFLDGLLHIDKAVDALLEGRAPTEAIALIPRVKREWLAFCGLYPLEPDSAAARVLERVVEDPEGFRSALTAMLTGFWHATFEETWNSLLPELRDSVGEKCRLFESQSFADFLRHTLLPIEFNGKKKALCAIRGGYELPVAQMGACTFTPSVFNTRKLWTVFEDTKPWLPYVEPDLGYAYAYAAGETDRGENAPDVALIFRALGDTTRFAMVSLIGRKPRTSVELAATLSVSKPTVSHHIHILRSAGLIHEIEHGGSMLISLRKQQIARISELALDRLFESRGTIDLVKTRKER